MVAARKRVAAAGAAGAAAPASGAYFPHPRPPAVLAPSSAPCPSCCSSRHLCCHPWQQLLWMACFPPPDLMPCS
eukprot:1157981-Pelagomonas_calceolata.AAC.1